MSLELILSIGGTVAAGGVAWGTALRSIKALEDRIKREEDERERWEDDVTREVERLREWRHDHEKEGGDYRVKFTEQIGSLATGLAKNDERFLQIMSMLEKITIRMDKIAGE